MIHDSNSQESSSLAPPSLLGGFSWQQPIFLPCEDCGSILCLSLNIRFPQGEGRPGCSFLLFTPPNPSVGDSSPRREAAAH